MKSLIASTAIALTLAAPSFAQTTTTTPTEGATTIVPTEGTTAAMPMEGMGSSYVGAIDTAALRASDVMGARLYVSEGEIDTVGGLSTDWDDVGEISDIVIGSSGGIDAVLLDIGGFLGLGERTVAVNMDNLQFVSDGPEADDFFIVMQGTREQLEAAPEFNPEFERGRVGAAANANSEGLGLTTQAGQENIVAGEGTTSLEPGTVVDAEQTPATAVVTEGGTVVTTTGDTDAATLETDAVEGAVAANEGVVGAAGGLVNDSATDVATTTGNAVEAVGGNVNDATSNVATATGNAVDATGEAATDAANATGAVVAGAAGAVAGAGAAVMGGMPSMEMEGYETVGLDVLTTEDVTGASVYDLNDERVGEIGELVMSPEGQLQNAVIDVGGFLGLGEKPVAVSFESLQVLRGENDVRIYIDTTAEALEALPAYEAAQ